jgi:hypothetical protein
VDDGCSGHVADLALAVEDVIVSVLHRPEMRETLARPEDE